MTAPTQVGMFFKWWIMGKGLKPGTNSPPEDTLTGVEFILVALATLAVLFFTYYLLTKALERRSNRIKLKDPLPLSGCKLLAKNSTFYNKLNKKAKIQFEKRVQHYINSKMFTAEDGYAVTEEMKVSISAAATQITFGLPLLSNTIFNHIHILVQPTSGDERKHSMRNSIVISWKNFVEGYAASDDGKNEGLKIMASALINDYQFQEKGYKIFSERKYRNWERAATEEAPEFMGGTYVNFANDNKLRNAYFANAVVYFFELPRALQQKYPKLYKAMVALLNQDTAKGSV